jgi:cytochrome c556
MNILFSGCFQSVRLSINLLANHRGDPGSLSDYEPITEWEGFNGMIKQIVVGAGILLAGIGFAQADGLDPIAVRQAGMALSGGDFAFIRSVVAAKGDVKPLEAPAKALAKWAAVIPSMFPKGTEKGGDTKALPEVWSDAAGFQKIALAMGEAATKLAVAAKAGDADEVALGAKALGEQCGACHKGYRAK